MIAASELKHGDVLCFDYNFHNLHHLWFQKLVQIVTGSKFEHTAIVWEVEGKLYVLEQIERRLYSLLDLYGPMADETIWAFRPCFPVPTREDVKSMLYRAPYGITSAVDILITHFLKRITFDAWRPKPILRRLFGSKNFDCSGLVATMLQLDKNTLWCKFSCTVEPGDFDRHSESFMPLGMVDWKSSASQR